MKPILTITSIPTSITIASIATNTHILTCMVLALPLTVTPLSLIHI